MNKNNDSYEVCSKFNLHSKWRLSSIGIPVNKTQKNAYTTISFPMHNFFTQNNLPQILTLIFAAFENFESSNSETPFNSFKNPNSIQDLSSTL